MRDSERMDETFSGSFTQQDALPQEAIDAALGVLRHGRLHRYNVAPGEDSEVALLEREFADLVGARHCVAVASGGYALAAALRAVGVGPGDRVLTNAFTLAPVPGAIAAVGATPIFVGVTEALTIDLAHLEARIAEGDSQTLLLSHMRGHVCDMDRLAAMCDSAGVAVIEDCAHTMGARWNGVPSGRHGAVGCYSTQTYKHVNSGEGGLLATDDDDIAAKAVLLSGSYMHYGRHLAAPDADAFARHDRDMPNMSGRMDNLRAAILRPQIARLEERVAAWNERYGAIEARLRGTRGLALVERDQRESYVGSSFQFLLPDWDGARVGDLVGRCAARGVELKWFGAERPEGFTSRYEHWCYAPQENLPATDRILAGLLDLRVPLTFSLEDCALISRIIRSEVEAAGTS